MKDNLSTFLYKNGGVTFLSWTFPCCPKALTHHYLIVKV